MKDALAYILVGLVLVGLIVWGVVQLRTPAVPGEGRRAPDFELPIHAADPPATTRLSAAAGRPVLFFIFSTECSACLIEMAALNDLAAELEPRGLVVQGVLVDHEPTAADEWIGNYPSLTVLEDPDGEVTRRALHADSLPAAYLIDVRGRFAAVFDGFVNWRATAIRDQILKLLPAQPPPTAAPAS